MGCFYDFTVQIINIKGIGIWEIIYSYHYPILGHWGQKEGIRTPFNSTQNIVFIWSSTLRLQIIYYCIKILFDSLTSYIWVYGKFFFTFYLYVSHSVNYVFRLGVKAVALLGRYLEGSAERVVWGIVLPPKEFLRESLYFQFSCMSSVLFY